MGDIAPTFTKKGVSKMVEDMYKAAKLIVCTVIVTFAIYVVALVVYVVLINLFG